jgi:hypothetical protein
MMEVMNQVALELGAERRREVLSESMRAARVNESRVRQVAGAALVAAGSWVAGERRPSPVTAGATMQPSGDCL